MKILSFLAPDASPQARQIAFDQRDSLARLGAAVVTSENANSIPDGYDVVHLHPGPSTTVEFAEEISETKPLLLHLADPRQAGAELSIAADQIVVPSRSSLVHLLDHAPLGPRQGRILFPGTSVEPGASESKRTAPLSLVHIGHRDPDSGLEDLVQALAAFGPDEITFTCAGSSDPGYDARLTEKGQVRITFQSEITPDLASAHLAVFPFRRAQSYALEVDHASILGLPCFVSGGDVLRERFDGSAYLALPSNDPERWHAELAECIADPSCVREARDHCPERIPTASAAAEVLLRWSRELLRVPLNHEPSLLQPAARKRGA